VEHGGYICYYLTVVLARKRRTAKSCRLVATVRSSAEYSIGSRGKNGSHHIRRNLCQEFEVIRSTIRDVHTWELIPLLLKPSLSLHPINTIQFERGCTQTKICCTRCRLYQVGYCQAPPIPVDCHDHSSLANAMRKNPPVITSGISYFIPYYMIEALTSLSIHIDNHIHYNCSLQQIPMSNIY
jgi:hypothetical protein